ncbi:hypothetical protein Prum_090120 [Phytohabitans rumicis]|uniref:Uncharacterized protein n=1 Tax=Phytohabitans rumicis TaxID=1076125 RepID=A0A6V8LIJ0_9ACTN|nr:hypothetical protein Prum_090120 [Phytohabitans rumicis]
MSAGGVEGVTVIDLTTPPARALERSAVVLAVAADGWLSSLSAEGRPRSVGPTTHHWPQWRVWPASWPHSG